MNDIVFPSKVDAWLLGVMGASLLLSLGLGVVLWRESPIDSAIVFAAAACIVLILATMVFPCRYTLKSDHLLIQAGLLRWRIPYESISNIEPSSNPLSAPALSLQRVKISYGRGFQLVSPVERDRFMAALRDQVAASQGQGS